MLDVSAVEAVRDSGNLGAVALDCRIEEVQIDPADADLPHVEAGDVVAQVDRHLDACGCEGQAVVVESGEPLLLIAVGIEALPEVPLCIEQTDGH